jgi:beta-galactosidase
VAVQIVDEAGNPLPRASHLIEFSVTGPGKIVAVDNGSIVSHEPFQATERKAFQGRAIAIVRATDANGTIAVHATVKGLEPGTVELTAVNR